MPAGVGRGIGVLRVPESPLDGCHAWRYSVGMTKPSEDQVEDSPHVPLPPWNTNPTRPGFSVMRTCVVCGRSVVVASESDDSPVHEDCDV